VLLTFSFSVLLGFIAILIALTKQLSFLLGETNQSSSMKKSVRNNWLSLMYLSI
jgi:hypothetical protein